MSLQFRDDGKEEPETSMKLRRIANPVFLCRKKGHLAAGSKGRSHIDM